MAYPLRLAAFFSLSLLASIPDCRANGPTPGAPQWLSQIQAQKDTRQLIRLLDESHPDPYSAFGGRVAFKLAADELMSGLPPEGIGHSALAERLAEFLARIKDGHTFLQALTPNAPSTILPFRFSAGPRGLFLSAWNLPALDGLLGARLVSIDGLSEKELLERSSRLRGTENESHARVNLRNELRTLEGMARLFGSAPPASVTLRLQMPGARAVSVAVALPRATDSAGADGWRARRPVWKQVTQEDQPFRYQFFAKHRVAYLALDTIMPREAYEMQRASGWGDIRAALDRHYRAQGKAAPEKIEDAIAGIPSLVEIGAKLLEEMKRHQTPYLIVDLENNGGGVTPSAQPLLYQIYGDGFLAAQAQSSYTTLYSSLYLKKFNTDLETIRRTWHLPELERGDFVTQQFKIENAVEARTAWLGGLKAMGVSGAARLERQDGEALYRPAQVVVLSGVDTFSAAFHLLAYFRALGAKVVGLPPGQSPNAFMEITPFQLTESGLSGSISNSAQFFVPEHPQQRVFAPDFPITDAVLARYGYDAHTALRYALELIRSRRL